MLNKFATPISEGSWRAILIAIGTFIVVTLGAYQVSDEAEKSERWEESLITGVIAAIAPLVGGVGIAASDQKRFSDARKGDTTAVKPADVGYEVAHTTSGGVVG